MTKNTFLILLTLLLTPVLTLGQIKSAEPADEVADEATATAPDSEVEADKTDVQSEKLSDGPQELPAASKAEPTQTSATEEIKTEAVSEAPVGLKLEEKPEEKLEEKKVVGKKVVSEEELLKPERLEKKKESSAVKASKVTESEVYIQEVSKYKLNEQFKNLHLNDVIEQGLRKNYQQNIRGQNDSLNEIDFKGAKDAFWLPELKINLTTSSQRIATLFSSAGPSKQTSITPEGKIGIALSDYTVFNWGKDYSLYLNKKSFYSRNKEAFNESKRELKLDLITQFFQLMISKNIEKIRQDQLRHASFIYRLNKEKIAIGKISKQDYYLARSEYLKAQNDYHDAKTLAKKNDENMAFLIADESGTHYVLSEGLDYRRVSITFASAVEFSHKNNPTLLSNKTLIEMTERSYDLAQKENMPLPKFSLNLGAYNKNFGAQTNSTNYQSSNGGNNVELVASLNASWALTGENGFLNSNKLAKSRIEKEIALKEYEKNGHYAESLIHQTYLNILSLQNQIVILEARLPSLQKTFDTILDNYLNNKTKYYDFHMILEELTTTKILFEETKFNHTKEKLNLSKLAGLEDFPGENFEHLATKIKEK